MEIYTTHKIQEIIEDLEKKLKKDTTITFGVLNPDLFENRVIGEIVTLNQTNFIFRDYKSWVDLAEKLFCKMLTPKILDENCVQITYKKLNKNDSFHNDIDSQEKYGTSSKFSKIDKNEEPEIIFSYLQALKNVNIEKKLRVLDLGINNGQEFLAIKEKYNNNFENIEFVGIDYSNSAIEIAEEKFKNHKNIKFYVHDINKLNDLNLGKFDLIISIGTLQSCNSNFKELFMKIVQNCLNKDGSMILGFPNCRWIDGRPVYGAKAPNYNFSEMSILYNDVIFCKKYLQQKKFRVTITGKYYIFLTATSIKKC